MAQLIDWAKLILENKWLVILLFGSITGLAGNVTQYFEVQAKDNEIEMTQKQVTAVANSYHQRRSPARAIYLKSDCSECKQLIKQHEQRAH